MNIMTLCPRLLFNNRLLAMSIILYNNNDNISVLGGAQKFNMATMIIA